MAGVRAETKDGPLEVRAALTIGADGRASVVQEKAGLNAVDIGAAYLPQNQDPTLTSTVMNPIGTTTTAGASAAASAAATVGAPGW